MGKKQIIGTGKEYAWGMETKSGDKPRFYIRVHKDKDEVIFETDVIATFTKKEFNQFCSRLGSIRCEES